MTKLYIPQSGDRVRVVAISEDDPNPGCSVGDVVEVHDQRHAKTSESAHWEGYLNLAWVKAGSSSGYHRTICRVEPVVVCTPLSHIPPEGKVAKNSHTCGMIQGFPGPRCEACFEAGRASRDGEVEALKSELATERTFSKECLEEKDRECHYRLKFSAQLADKEAALSQVATLISGWREFCSDPYNFDPSYYDGFESGLERAADDLERALEPASKGESDG